MKKIIAVTLFSLISINFIGCLSDIQPRPEPVIPTDSSSCGAACSYLMTLRGLDGNPGCFEARPLIDGDKVISCEQFCIETQNNGRSLCPSRWHEAKECDDIEELRLNCGVNYK